MQRSAEHDGTEQVGVSGGKNSSLDGNRGSGPAVKFCPCQLRFIIFPPGQADLYTSASASTDRRWPEGAPDAKPVRQASPFNTDNLHPGPTGSVVISCS